jgi:hypothetical protein
MFVPRSVQRYRITGVRMPVITIAQSKGGAGKTTLALALASEFEALGGSVFMLDADRQNSLLNWYRDRMNADREGGAHHGGRRLAAPGRGHWTRYRARARCRTARHCRS